MTVSRQGPMYDPLRNRGVAMLPFIYVGFVKDNSDPQRMGRLSVWIPELGGHADDPASWVIASYMSPFAGATDINSIPNFKGNSQIGQQSYGLWLVPPDLNNEVCVFFAAGDVSRAYWIGCTYQQNMNHMVPGIAVDVTTEPQPPVHVSPVTEYNKANVAGNVDSPPRPPFHPLTDGLNTEGLTSDHERGSPSTSARREVPSQVFGLLTPRGNTIHIDEQHSGDNATGSSENEFIRLRTRSGTQVMIDETTGFVYINSKNGNAWLEVSDAGVDIYSMNSVSIRAQQDFNIRADRNIIFDAGASIYLNAGQNISGACKNLAFTAAASGSLQVTNGNLDVKASNLHLESESNTSLKAGGTQARDGSAIYDDSGMSVSASVGSAMPAAGSMLDTKQTGSGNSFQWTSGGGNVNTIVSRMPTHEPWRGHPSSLVPPPPLDDVAPVTGPQGPPNLNAIANDGCAMAGAANTKPVSTVVYNSITSAASTVGADQATMFAFADLESGFNPNISASVGSASGLFQFTSATWDGMVNQYGNLYNVSSGQINDPSANALMGAQLIKNNTQTLQNAGIANPTPGQVYMLNFLGPSGGVKMIKMAQTNPDADASLAFPAAAANNRSIFQGRTVGQVNDLMQGKANAKAAAYAGQQGLPAPCTRAGATATSGANTSAGTPTGAVKAAEGNLGQSGAQVNNFLHTNGVSLDASQQNWCAAYVNASLQASGVKGDGSNVATSFANWGQPVTGDPQQGDVMVLMRGLQPGQTGGHVGMFTGNVVNGQYEMIQGNYGGKVALTYENPSNVTIRRAN